MRFYATIAGCLQYRSQPHLEAVLDRLQADHWLDEDHRWISDGCTGSGAVSPAVDFDRLLLVIPHGMYRNLARITTDLFAGAVDGQLAISSIDGCFDAWITATSRGR